MMVAKFSQHIVVHTRQTLLEELHPRWTRCAHQTRLQVQQIVFVGLFGRSFDLFGRRLLFQEFIASQNLFTVFSALLEDLHEFVSGIGVPELSSFVWIKTFITIDI